MSQAVRRLPVVVGLVLLCRCGGASPMPAASPAPAAAPDERREEAPAPSVAPGGGGVAPPPAQPPPPPPPLSQERDQRKAERMAAGADLDRAQSELEAAASDCESACRALASMERATTHLCSLAEDASEQRRCDDAKVRLTAAKGRVRAACGACR